MRRILAPRLGRSAPIRCRVNELTVRVAIIGAGVMGADHASIISEDIPGADLRVVCDVSDKAARRVADNCGAQDVSTDAVETIKRKDIDAVLIASPDPTHASLTLSALDMHKPVLCEKPLALSAAESFAVVEAERDIDRQLVQVGFMRRFDPAYVEMKSALLAGQIGQAVMMHNFHRNVSAPASFTGLMAVTNSAPHEFDAVRFVLDTEITAISAFEPAIDNHGICKPVVAILETLHGQLVTVEVNNNAGYGYDVRGELVGTEGSVMLSNQSAIRIDKDLRSGSSYAADWRPRFRKAYRLQNKAWIKAIATGTPALTAANAWDGYCATVIAEAAALALTSGEKITLDMAERPAMYAAVGVAA